MQSMKELKSMKPDESHLEIAKQWLDYARSDLELAATRSGEGILPVTLCFWLNKRVRNR